VPTDDRVSIFPNPANGNFLIKLPAGTADKYEIALFNTNGIRVFAGEYDGGTQSIDGGPLPAGLYIVTIRSKEFTITKKIIIQK
jgi:hypothetical protein